MKQNDDAFFSSAETFVENGMLLNSIPEHSIEATSELSECHCSLSVLVHSNFSAPGLRSTRTAVPFDRLLSIAQNAVICYKDCNHKSLFLLLAIAQVYVLSMNARFENPCSGFQNELTFGALEVWTIARRKPNRFIADVNFEPSRFCNEC